VEGAKEYTAPKDLVEYASPLKNAPGPVFTVSIPEKGMPETVKRVILLENVQDPGNVGTVIRTANALGMDAVILTGNCADVFGAKTARAAMGALFRQTVLTMQQSEAVAWLHEQGLRVYGAALSDRAVDVRTVSLGDAAFVIGSEGQGLSEEMLSLCDGEVIIPMEPGSESLNAGVAAAILMWELAR
jgi:TrmH family RNA methyltransferase